MEKQINPANIIDSKDWMEIVKGRDYLDILKAPTSIQTNKMVLLQLLRFHPEQFKSNTLFSAFKADPEFMLDAIGIDPSFVEYVSRDLLFDEEFKSQVASVSNEAAIVLEEERTRVEMVDAAFKAGEIVVVATVLAANPSIISAFTQEMKDSYELMSVASSANEEIQNYVAINKEEFGTEGIRAVKDNVETEAKDAGIEKIESMRSSSDSRYAKVADKIQEVGKDNSRTMRYMSAMITQPDMVDKKQARQIIEYAILQMEMTYRGRDENGVMQTSTEEMMKLLPSQLLDKIVQKSGILEEMPELAEKVEEYKTRSEEYTRQFREQKVEKREQRKSELETETKEVGIAKIHQMSDSPDRRYEKVSDKIRQIGEDDSRVMRYMTAMLAVQDEISPEYAKQIYEYSQLQMQTAFTQEPSKQNMLKLLPPKLLRTVVDKSGIANEDPDMKKRLDTYEKNFERYQDRNRQKQKIREDEQQQRTQVRITKGEMEVTVDSAEVKKDGYSEMLHVISRESIVEATIENVTKQGIEEKAVEVTKDIQRQEPELVPQKEETIANEERVE